MKRLLEGVEVVEKEAKQIGWSSVWPEEGR